MVSDVLDSQPAVPAEEGVIDITPDTAQPDGMDELGGMAPNASDRVAPQDVDYTAQPDGVTVERRKTDTGEIAVATDGEKTQVVAVVSDGDQAMVLKAEGDGMSADEAKDMADDLAKIGNGEKPKPKVAWVGRTKKRARDDSLDAAEAEVIAAAADGVVTPAEAEKAGTAAGQVLAEAQQDTPDNPAPKRSYRSRSDIDAAIRELCDDPAKMQQLLNRAKGSADESQRQDRAAKARGGDTDGDGKTVTPEAASAASAVLTAARESRPAKPRGDPKPRAADVELLRRAVTECKTTDPSAPVAAEAKKFLSSSAPDKVQFRSKSPAGSSSTTDADFANLMRGSGKTEKAGRTRNKSGKSTRRRRAPKPVVSYG